MYRQVLELRLNGCAEAGASLPTNRVKRQARLYWCSDFRLMLSGHGGNAGILAGMTGDRASLRTRAAVGGMDLPKCEACVVVA